MPIFSMWCRYLTPKSWVRGFFALIASVALHAHAGEPQISSIRYLSGELRINGRFCAANQAQFPGARPLILFNHGGVSGVGLNNERRMLELCRLGYTLAGSSYRGEDGSDGQIEVALGEVDDVLALLAHLKREPMLDLNRVALLGFSHGALISLQAAKRQPNSFKAVVFAYGVADIDIWYRYLQKTNQLGKDELTQRIYGRGPVLSPENFKSRQGMLGLDHIASNLPILIVQGQRDVIVPASQAELLLNRLILLGKRVSVHRSANGRHGYLIRREALAGNEKRESDVAWRVIEGFLEDELKPLQ